MHQCHRPGGAGQRSSVTMLEEPEWLLSHVRDPEIIAPGLREPPRAG